MIIGVDLDDTICGFMDSFIAFHNEVYSTNFHPEDFTGYTLTETIGGTREEEIAKIIAFYESPHFTRIKPIPGAKNVLSRLKKDGHELRIVTARHAHKHDETEKWLNQEFSGIFSGVHYAREANGDRKNKSTICLAIGASVLIEDSGENAIECAEQAIKSILLDQPWNQKHSHTNILRIKSWDDAHEAISSI